MDKIKELVKQLGASEEFSSQLLEELDRYSASVREGLEKKYQDRIKRAKQICVEEVAREKASLSRKVEIFMESKVAAIERAAAKQRAIEESAAIVQLRKVKSLLGATDGNSAELQALNRKLARIAEEHTALKEERNHAIEKANRANAIASRVLKKNRILESKTSIVAPADPPARAGGVIRESVAARPVGMPPPVMKARPVTTLRPAGAQPVAEPRGVSGRSPTPDEIAASISAD